MRYPQIFLNAKKAKNFKGFHPWVMDRSLIEPAAGLEAGQIVELLFSDGRWIGRGVYNPHSRIRLRLYQWDPSELLDQDWCLSRVKRAIEMRNIWMQNHRTLDSVRLVNSEGDGLSGLIVDRFGDFVVIQVTALAMLAWLDEIADLLMRELQPAGILLRMDARTATSEGMEFREEVLRGSAPEQPVQIVEHDVPIAIDLMSGQKTGYYLDQRANRLRAAKWVGTGPMLDMCCYLGGFSLAAAKWSQPESILAVDSSSRALEQASAIAASNGFEQIQFKQADCFEALDELLVENRKFQTVVLDPPRLAGNRSQVAAALRAYYRLNLSAVSLLHCGGMLITCSCSGRVTRSDFAGMLASVAKKTGRAIQIVESAGADFDHPIDASCPETEYLKCFVCRVN